MLQKRRNIFCVTKDAYISKWVDLGLICSSMSFDPLHPITKWAGLERLCPGRPNLSSVFISFAHGFGSILGYKPVIYIEFVKSVRPTSMYAYQKGRTAWRSCYLGPLPCVCVCRWFHVCLSASSVLILGIASHLALGLWGSSLPCSFVWSYFWALSCACMYSSSFLSLVGIKILMALKLLVEVRLIHTKNTRLIITCNRSYA